MVSSCKFFPAIVVLLLLFVSTEATPAHAETLCESDSARFTGVCVMRLNCANICQTEGFTYGKCSGWERKCVCSKPC